VKLKYISVKLLLLITAVLLIGEVLQTLLAINIHRKHLMARMEMNTNRTSEVILRSIYHGMLKNDKESIRRTIATIGQGQGVTAVRIYNKQGEIIVSTQQVEVGTQVDMAAEACDGCHVPGKPLPVKSEANYARVYRQSTGDRQLGMIRPIKNEPTCSEADCHAHPASNTVLGVLDVQMSLASVDRSLVEEIEQLLFLSGATILFAVGLMTLFLWRAIHLPVRRLIHGTQEVAAGNLHHRTEIHQADELGQLAESFNSMVIALESAQKELQQWADTLEEQVEKKSKELEQVQRHILGVEKIASLGRLSTTAAHELNNPLASILNYSKLVLRQLHRLPIPQDVKEVVEKDLRFIRDESRRCGDIVNNLLLFAGRTGGTFEQVQVRDIIEKSLMLVAHMMEMQNIDMDLQIDDEADTITCDPAQLQQALVAVLINALEAMSGGGTLTFTYWGPPDSEFVEFRISDSGRGIPDEHMEHIFEPFYTTKPDGKSVGMGLSVVYGIVQRHNGTIKVQSTNHEGTVCIIRLPRRQSLTAAVKSPKAMPEV